MLGYTLFLVIIVSQYESVLEVILPPTLPLLKWSFGFTSE